MFTVRFDPKTSRLVLIYGGRVDTKQAQQMLAEIQKLTPQLEKGFTVLTDLTSLERMDAGVEVHIKKAMDLFSKCGVAMAVRIIPDRRKDIGFNIMSLFHYSRAVRTHTFVTRKDADEYLRKNRV